MSTPAAQVRVRLSAEGVRDVVSALKTVERQAKDTAGKRGIGALNDALGNFKRFLPAIGVGAAVAGLTAIARSAINTADQLAKLSVKTGATVEQLSALQTAGQFSGVSTEQIAAGFARVSKNIGELQTGSKETVSAFRALGLSFADFENKNPAEAFSLIAQRITALSDPFAKARIGNQIFGRSFADLLPLLVAVGEQGLDPLIAKYQELGIIISGDLATAAEQAKDSFELIQRQAGGLANSFLSGFLPSIVAAFTGISNTIEGKGVDSFKRFGEVVGRVARVIIAALTVVGRGISNLVEGFGSQIFGLGQIARAVFEGEFEVAGNIWRRLGREGRQDFDNLLGQLNNDLKTLVSAATESAPPIELEIRPKVDSSIADALEKLERQRQQSAQRNQGLQEVKVTARRIDEDKLRIDQIRAEAKARAEAASQRFDLEQRILELTGKGDEARLRALDAELAKIREKLTLNGRVQLTSQDEAALGQVRDIEAARIQIEEAVNRAQVGFDELRLARERIEQDVALGILSQYQGQQQILALEKERLATLQAIAEAALAAALASGDPVAIAQAQALVNQVRQVEVSVNAGTDALTRLRNAAEDALQGSLENVLTNLQDFDSVGDVFRSLALSVVQSLQQIAAQMLSTYITAKLFQSVFGQTGSLPIPGAAKGGPVGYATGGAIDATAGGKISGPGTSTSDSIPAVTTSGKPLLLSDGEFIVRASVVRQPGMLDVLRRINNGAASMSMMPRGMPRRFAEGGMVSDPAPAKAGAAGFAGVIGLEPGLVMKELESESFDRLLIKKLERNRSTLRSILS